MTDKKNPAEHRAPPHIGFDTLSLHAGQRPDSETGARATPIYQSTSFVFRDATHAASLFDIGRSGHVYSRISNPTVGVLEERVAALEGGVGAVCTASGMAAIHLGIATLAGAGTHVVASRSLYGGTHNLLSYTLPRFGVETTFVDPSKPEEFAAAIRPETRLLFAETVSNPAMEVLNIPEVSAIAHDHGIPLLVDATLTTPYLMKPFELGADIVMHSLTKFMGGHGVAIGGALVDSGNFDWEGSGRFPELAEPYDGFHGMDFVEEFGPYAFIMRARKEGLRKNMSVTPKRLCGFWLHTSRSQKCCTPCCRSTLTINCLSNCCHWVAERCSVLNCRVGVKPADGLLMHCSCFHI